MNSASIQEAPATAGENGQVQFLSPSEQQQVQVIADLAYCNPFQMRRLELERALLGGRFNQRWAAADLNRGPDEENPNRRNITDMAEQLLAKMHQRLIEGARPAAAQMQLYEDVVMWVLYHRYRHLIGQFIEQALARAPGAEAPRFTHWSDFQRDFGRFLEVPRVVTPPTPELLGHGLAMFFQIRRAFYHIYRNIVGASRPIVRLRAAIWQSIFTHDMRRYRRMLYQRMVDCTTLVVGPSGTGKELVARAIGLSRYIPFDPKRERFREDFAGSFTPINLSTLSPTLIESELFGHKRGAFTGALADRSGYLEICPPLGTVFLDEIGELDAAIQVKLLRVLQTRTFQRIGDAAVLNFEGKIIAATNRDLTQAMDEGRFREDFYYRLCSDIITTPSLREQIADQPECLRPLVGHIARWIAGDEGPALTDEVMAYIDEHLGGDYPWLGNVRELEQCVRNVMIRHEYVPPRTHRRVPGPQSVAEQLLAGDLSADEVLSRYCTIVYAKTGSYVETAQRLGIDRRTVKARIDADLLAALREG